MKNKNLTFQKLFLLTLVLLFLLPGCKPPVVTVWCVTGVQYVSGGEEAANYETLTYDENGNLLELSRNSDTWKYTYDDRGNMLSCHVYKYGGTLQEHTIYTYDNKNNKITENTYQSDDRFLNGCRYTYDAKGRLTGEIRLDQDGIPTGWRTEYTYDKNGKVLARKSLNADDAVTYLEEWVYDRKGNLIEERKETDYSTPRRAVYTYDSDGRILTKTVESNGQATDYSEYIYDESGGTVIEQYAEEPGGAYHRRSYTFDEKGNLLERATLRSDGTPVMQAIWTYDSAGNVLSYDRIESGYRDHMDWTYDEEGRALTRQQKSSGYTFENDWGYDQHGNLTWMSYEIDGDTGFRYTYTAIELPQEQAEKVLAQQAEILEDITNVSDFAPHVTPLIEYLLEIPEPDRIFPYMGETTIG